MVLNNLIEAVELVGKRARGGKPGRVFHRKPPVRRRRIVHKSTGL